MIERECPAQGYIYVGTVPLDFLGPLAEPPWMAFVGGLEHERAMKTMVLECPGGDIFSANFSARLVSESALASGPCPGLAYSITGLRLAPGAPLSRIADYVAGLMLDNGLSVVMSGDCIYAMVKPGGTNALELHYRKRMQLMRAMLCIVEGKFDDATCLFAELSCQSTPTTWFGLPLGIAALISTRSF